MKKYVRLLSTVAMSVLFSQAASAAAPNHHKQNQMDIVAVAMHNKNLSTLVTAIKAAGLVDTLKGVGPFTVFAPTNEAFAKLPKGTLDSLLKDKTQLVAVLTYHVVPGKVTAAQVQNGPVNTVQGQPITLTKTAKGVMVNDAKVVKADVMASNGVIHEINMVLMPATQKSAVTAPAMTAPATTAPDATPMTTPETTATPAQ